MSVDAREGRAEAKIPAGWIADSALELVARRLRVLGFDVQSGGGARLEELVERARRDGRGVLTTSARRPHRVRDVLVVSLPRADPMAAVRRVAAIAAPVGRPFRRCTVCNTLLVRVEAGSAAEVPEDVRASGSPIRRCPGCGRAYWAGSHTDRLRRWLEAALARPIAGPADPD